MKEIRDAIVSGTATSADFAAMEVPDHYRALTVHADESGMFEGVPRREKDPRKSLHVEDVPTPELGPGEAIVAVMASAINYNTVWTSIFEPVPTFGFLQRYGRTSPLAKRHDLPYHVVGSDLAGVVLRVGPGVHLWKPGDEVVAHCLSVELERPEGHDDTMLDPEQRIWGFETNFGGLAELALVKANQLMPKTAHLTWEEAAVARAGELDRLPPARLQPRGADEARRRRPRLGRLRRARLVRHPDGPRVRRDPGVRRLEPGEGGDLPADGCRARHRPRRRGLPVLEGRGDAQDPKEWKRFGARIRELTGGRDVDIVFEHPGRETFGASVYVTRRGGTIVTCASTSGFMHVYDNRYLWMNLKRIIGSHFANYAEAWHANDLIARGLVHPTAVEDLPARSSSGGGIGVHRNLHQGKVGVLCLAPGEGLGVRDPELRSGTSRRSCRFRNV